MKHTQLKIMVKPNANHNRIQVFEDSIDLWIKAPPTKGKANKAIIQFISEILELNSMDLDIVHGLRSSIKILDISGLDEEDVRKKLIRYQLTQKRL